MGLDLFVCSICKEPWTYYERYTCGSCGIEICEECHPSQSTDEFGAITECSRCDYPEEVTIPLQKYNLMKEEMRELRSELAMYKKELGRYGLYKKEVNVGDTVLLHNKSHICWMHNFIDNEVSAAGSKATVQDFQGNDVSVNVLLRIEGDRIKYLWVPSTCIKDLVEEE